MSMYSRPTKSTSSAYAISLGIFSSNDNLGLPKTVRTSFRACSRYMVKSTAFISALFILVLMCVLLNKNCMSLSSSSSTMFFRICRRISLSMVSKAADMSIPVIFIFMFSATVFAASHLWVQTTSEVLRSGLKPL